LTFVPEVDRRRLERDINGLLMPPSTIGAEIGC
jgi:hypothetical protein